MIKHIVMWKFKDEVSDADKLEMKRQLEALQGSDLARSTRGIYTLVATIARASHTSDHGIDSIPVSFSVR